MAIDYSTLPLTFQNVGSGDNSFYLKKTGSPTTMSLQYSKNDGIWTTLSYNTPVVLSPGDKVAISGNNSQISDGGDYNHNVFITSGAVGLKLYGNINSLVNFGTERYCYYEMFSGATQLVDAQNLIFPSKSVAMRAFIRMFKYCTNLSAAPKDFGVQNFDNNSKYCFFHALEGCAKLNNNIILRAQTVNTNTYEYAFEGCTSMQVAPLLSASTYSSIQNVFDSMYYNCSSLSAIEVKFTAWPTTSNATKNWVNNVASNGLFIKPSALSISRGVTKIPSNWTVLNRINDKLYYAEATNGHSVGDEYTGADPYAWYYSPSNYGTNLCFKSTGNTTISLNKIGNPQNTTIQYSKDGINWSNATGAITLNDGDCVVFSGNAKFSKNIQNRYSFSTAGAGTLAVSGYLSSLVSSATIEDDYEFNSLFSGCTNITDVSGLILPSNTTDWCYANMFIDCSNLTNTPKLFASTLNKWCYSSMFANCQSLANAPTLSATDLANSCYYCMFYGCKNLTVAPTLPASTLTDWCYNSMFYNDSKLNSMKVSFTSWTPSTATSNWVKGLTTSGLFKKPDELSAIYDSNHIPIDWSISGQPVQDYSQMPLTFKSHGTTYLNLRARGTSTPNQNFYISRNGGAWQFYCAKTDSDSYTNMTNQNGPIITLTDGQTVAFSGTLNNFSYNSQTDRSEWQFNNYTSQTGSQANWDSSNYLQAYGNVKSLHNWQTLDTNQCYRSMFRDSTMISSCFNVVFENDSNLNRANGYASVYRDSRVVINPRMVTFSDTSYANLLDYTWNGDSYIKYVGYSRGSWLNFGGNFTIQNGGVFCKTPTTPIPNSLGSNVTIINWHESDNTYWVVNSSNQETGQQVILNNDGTITYI